MSVYELFNSQLERLIDHFTKVLEKNRKGIHEPWESGGGTPLTDVDAAAVQLARKLIPSFKQDHALVKKQIALEQNHSMQEGDPHLVLSSVKPWPTDDAGEFLGSLEESTSKYSFLNGDEIIQIVPLYPNNVELPDETGNVLYDVLKNEVICTLHKQSNGEHILFEIKADTDGYHLIQHARN